jgi:glycosyltransferase involved in cell wall biosynthesis
MINKPELTIGIAFKNPGQDFIIALQSMFAQSFADWELILCDDGSTDGALEFAQSLDDPRLRVISDGGSRGLAPRLNQMVSLARGNYFFRMDADDIMHPDRLLNQLAVLERSGAVVGTSAIGIDANNTPISWKAAATRQQKGFAARHSFFHPTVAANVGWFRTNAYTEHHVYHRAEDAELWCRTTGSSKFEWMQEPLMFIREVGVFSHTKHIGTSLGVLHLAHERSRTGTERVNLLTRELGKLWITLVLDAVGKVDWLVSRRGRALSSAELDQGKTTIQRIQAQELPTLQRFGTLHPELVARG